MYALMAPFSTLTRDEICSFRFPLLDSTPADFELFPWSTTPAVRGRQWPFQTNLAVDAAPAGAIIRQGSTQSRFHAGNDHPLNFAGALVNFSDLGISEVTLYRHFLTVAHATVKLNGLVGYPHGRFRSDQFGH